MSSLKNPNGIDLQILSADTSSMINIPAGETVEIPDELAEGFRGHSVLELVESSPQPEAVAAAEPVKESTK